MRRNQRRTISNVTAGVLLLAAAVLFTYFAFSKSVPFRSHHEFNFEFQSSNNVKKNSFVRIGGVNVGKVVGVDAKQRDGRTISVVRVRLDDRGLPLHNDAAAKIRPRIFLEGNFFLDIKPGTPSAPVLHDGDTIAASHNAAPVQLDQVLTSLQADTRKQLQTLLQEYATAVTTGGPGFNRSIRFWRAAYRDSALVNQATLGQAPHDLSAYIADSGKVADALDRDPAALKGLITDFDTTAAAFAREQGALEQTVAELPRTLRAAQPALSALNQAFPPLRRLVADLRPAVRSSDPVFTEGLPFATQARALVSQPELRGLVADLRPVVPALARLNIRTVPFLNQVRTAASCQNLVILPWTKDRIKDPNFPTPGPVYEEFVRGLPGIGGESRSGDANGQWARVLAGNGVNAYELSKGVFGNTTLPLLGVNPPKSDPPPLRADVPCETQQAPNLLSTAGAPPRRINTSSLSPAGIVDRAVAYAKARAALRGSLVREGHAARLKAQGFQPLSKRELAEIGKGKLEALISDEVSQAAKAARALALKGQRR